MLVILKRCGGMEFVLGKDDGVGNELLCLVCRIFNLSNMNVCVSPRNIYK